MNHFERSAKQRLQKKKEAYLCCLFSKIQKIQVTALRSMGLGSKAVVPGGGPQIFAQPPRVKLQGTTASSGHIPTR